MDVGIGTEISVRRKERTVILIVGHNEADAAFYKRCLSKRGFAVHVAPAGQQALAMLRQLSAHCILLDHHQPSSDDVDLLSRLTNDHDMPYVPVVLTTERGNEDIAVSAWKMGVADYVSRTDVTPELLEQTVRDAVYSAAVRRERLEDTLGSASKRESAQKNTDDIRRLRETIQRELGKFVPAGDS